MLFTHSAVQKIVSQISDLRCWMFQSGLWEKGSEVVFLNEHVYLSHFVLRCGCQTCRSVEKLNPKRMITVNWLKAANHAMLQILKSVFRSGIMRSDDGQVS